jgi:hypothetical protein
MMIPLLPFAYLAVAANAYSCMCLLLEFCRAEVALGVVKGPDPQVFSQIYLTLL